METFTTLSEIPRELIADGPLGLWGLLAFLFEGCANEADRAIGERYPDHQADRANATATGATRPHDDAVYDHFRAGDGIIRIAWPIKEPTP